MWSFLGEHPGWGLVYLTLVCFTVAFTASSIAATVVRRTPERPASNKNHDMVN